MNDRELLEFIAAQVGGLTSEIGTIKSEVGGLTSEIGTIKSEVGALTSEMGILKSNVDNLTKDVSEIKEGQNEIESEISMVKSITIGMEQSHGKQLVALFDGYKLNADKLDRIEKEVSKHEEVILRRIR